MKWIPMRWEKGEILNEMPGNNQYILVTLEYYNNDTKRYKRVVKIDKCIIGKNYELESGKPWNSVTAWMPLVEPYKREVKSDLLEILDRTLDEVQKGADYHKECKCYESALGMEVALNIIKSNFKSYL